MIGRARSMSNMDVAAARLLLASHVPAHEVWDQHSEAVAKVTRYLSEALESVGIAVDRRFVLTAALLHDIGRSRTHHPSLHGLAGYEILTTLGYPSHALACLTHVLKGRTLEESYDEGIFEYGTLHLVPSLQLSPLNIEHKILALADSIVLDTEVVDLSTRYQRSKRRYASYPFIRRNESLARQLQASLEGMLGRSIYTALPDNLRPPMTSFARPDSRDD